MPTTSTFDARQRDSFDVLLTQNVTSSSVINVDTAEGKLFVFKIVQNVTGGWSFTWPGNFIDAPTIETGPNSMTRAVFYFDGTNFINISSDKQGKPLKFYAPASGTITIDCNAYDWFEFTLNGDLTIATTGGIDSKIYTFSFAQDATGGHSVTYPGNFSGTRIISGKPSAISAQSYRYSAAFTLFAPTDFIDTSEDIRTVGGSVTFDGSKYTRAIWTLSGNVTVSLANIRQGEIYYITVIQGGGFTCSIFQDPVDPRAGSASSQTFRGNAGAFAPITPVYSFI